MRGGQREGAGRPAGSTKPDKRQSVTVRLPPDLITALAGIDKKGLFIEQAIREKLSKFPAN